MLWKNACIQVLIVNNRTLFWRGLSEILEAEQDIVVVAEAHGKDEAVALSEKVRPDVIILDFDIGKEASSILAEISFVSPESRVIVLSTSDSTCEIRSLLKFNIRAFMLKNITGDEVLSAIRRVCADDGRIILSVSRLGLASINGSPTSALSKRERDVLLLVAQAMTNAQVARRLHISEGTVKRHLRNVFTKLGAVSRIDAVNKALDTSLIVLPGNRDLATDRRLSDSGVEGGSSW